MKTSFILLSSFWFLLRIELHVDAEMTQFVLLTTCPTTSNYTSNSPFQSNLNTLLRSLYYNGTRDGYFSSTVGASPDTVYGLVNCRGDLSMPDCGICLNYTIVELTQRCRNSRVAMLRDESCLLRYSDQSFLSQRDDSALWLISSQNVTDAVITSYNMQLTSLMTSLSITARVIASRYASRSIGDIYGLAQCTRDLTPDDCYLCLQNMITTFPSCCNRSVGARIFTKTCNIRYELFPFTQVPAESPQPPVDDSMPPLPPLPTSNTTVTQEGEGTGKGKSANVVVIVVPIVAAAVLLFAICGCLITSKIRNQKKKTKPQPIYDGDANKLGEGGKANILVDDGDANKLGEDGDANKLREGGNANILVDDGDANKLGEGGKANILVDDRDEIRSEEFMQFDLDTIRKATNNFSDANKLGEGGFGAVYKGKLLDGHVIAVKTLSKNLAQGSQESKNEVVLIQKLQHPNLVRLLGFDLSGEEKLLIYEYVPNTSLDKYIFDTTKNSSLDWERRYKIVGGIAQGLLYLHDETRLQIHRDLKARNILLDKMMNPKIADFGMAKLFVTDQTQGDTRRFPKTFGYMAGEYASKGLFSVKSDVYSFGVLLLEIVSGLNASDMHISTHSRDLLSYAWNLWREGNPLQLMDPILTESFLEIQVMRCIHIGLLCVQDNINDRPTISSVVSFLNNYSLPLPNPTQPSFLSKFITGGSIINDDVEYNESTSSPLLNNVNGVSSGVDKSYR